MDDITDRMTVVFTSSHPDGVMTTTVTADLEWTADGCMIVSNEEFNPSDNPENLLSSDVDYWVSMINSTIIVPLLFLIGVPGNVLSAIVFYKQGLKDRINMCIFSLAVVDVMVLTVTFLLSAETSYRELIGPASFFISNFVGFTGFGWVSMFLSAVIASERCFCVVSPFKAKEVLSTSTMAVIIVVVSFVLLGGMIVIAGHKHTMACVFDPATNTTSEIIYVTDYYLRNKEILDIFDVFVYSTALPFLFLLIIIVTTAITAGRLRAVQAKRKRSLDAAATTTTPGAATTTKDGKPVHSKREMALTRMLIGTSVLFIVCLAPMLMVQVATFIVPDLSYEGHYHNLTSVLWNLISMFRCINSSTNFFVYYKMGSKFRETLKVVLSCGRHFRVRPSDTQHTVTSQ